MLSSTSQPQKRAPLPLNLRNDSGRRNLIGVAIALLIGLFSAHAIWRVDYLPFTHDGLHHIFRLYALDQAIRGGDWFPTRFPSMSFGYGSAILNYYPPLALYAWEMLRLMGLGFVKAFQVGYTIFAVVAALSSYWLGTLLRDRWTGAITAFIYTFSPYVLFDLYARSALSEYAALALAPLLFVTLHSAMLEDRWIRWLAFSAAVALVIYAHFLSLLLFLPLLAIYTVCLWIDGHGRRPATLARLLGAGIFGLLLSAFYWLPALIERGGVRVPGGEDALASYVEGILPLGQLFSGDFTILLGYYSTATVQLVNLPLWLGLLGAVTVALWQLARGQRRDKILFGGALAGLALSLVLITAPSETLWRLLSPITILQFPFRWLGVASLSMALLVERGSLGGFDGTASTPGSDPRRCVDAQPGDRRLPQFAEHANRPCCAPWAWTASATSTSIRPVSWPTSTTKS
ncbi:MAG: 6-pyruvoyl-tetrahydropterin synthase-related protein [Caldilineaceae bacterium]